MLRVRTTWTAPVGGPYLSTHYFSGLEDPTHAQTVATRIGDFWTSVSDVLAEEAAWAVEATVDALDEATGTLTDSFAVTPANGAGLLSNGHFLPAAAQALVRWNTSQIVNGKRVRGRTFIPGIGENFNDDGMFTSAGIGIVLPAAQLLTGNELVVWHRPTLLNPSGGVAVSVDSASVWNQFAVLTSRRD